MSALSLIRATVEPGLQGAHTVVVYVWVKKGFSSGLLQAAPHRGGSKHVPKKVADHVEDIDGRAWTRFGIELCVNNESDIKRFVAYLHSHGHVDYLCWESDADDSVVPVESSDADDLYKDLIHDARIRAETEARTNSILGRRAQATVEPSPAYEVEEIDFNLFEGGKNWDDLVFDREKKKAKRLALLLAGIFSKHGIKTGPWTLQPRKDRSSDVWWINPGPLVIPAHVLPKLATDIEDYFKSHPGRDPFDKSKWMRAIRNHEEVYATVEPTGLPGVEDTIQLASDWWVADKLLTVKTQHFGEVHLGDVNDQSMMFDIVRGPYAGVTLFLTARHGLRFMLDMARIDTQPVEERVWDDKKLQRAAQRGVSAFRAELGACFDRNFVKIEAVIREARR